jgi:hypothetical protein
VTSELAKWPSAETGKCCSITDQTRATLQFPFVSIRVAPDFGYHRTEPILPSLHNNLARGIYNASSILRRIGGIAFDALRD